MLVSDTLNLAQDAVDFVEGRMSATELAESTAIRVPIIGDAYGAGKVVGERLEAAADAWPASSETDRAIQDSLAQDAAVQARLGGATDEEAVAIREALSAGDHAEAARLAAALNQRGIEYEVPEQPVSYWVAQSPDIRPLKAASGRSGVERRLRAHCRLDTGNN